jgi:DNA-binding MarR family transcriptional regulator
VRRERDESDRRKVFIATVPENIAKVGKFYQHMQRAMLKEWDSYSDAELKLLLRFMTQGYTTMLGAIEQLKAMLEAPEDKRPSRKPAKAP